MRIDTVPALRIRDTDRAAARADGDWVVYWMIASRRRHWNFGLQRAADWAAELRKPLIVLEALRCGYRWASDRLHTYVLQGMADNAAAFRDSAALYYPYVEPTAGAGRGLLEALADRACVVVTDFPCFFLPRMVAAAAARLPVRLEAVDSNGILPMRAADQVFPTAYAFRRFLQRTLRPYLDQFPLADPLANRRFPRAKLPADIARRWPAATDALLSGGVAAQAALPIDHAVGPASFAGGADAAGRALDAFLERRLDRYDEARNDCENEAASGLSPYLHFGHISPHKVLSRVIDREDWTPERLSAKANGGREGWWGMSPPSEAFLDQLITWRELGYNFCWQRDDYDQFDSLPAWALQTLDQHAADPRPHVYTLAQFESAATQDPLWNAAQTQLTREGRLHNYLRMLWGKKILEWSATPRDALDTMIELNNKYAVDGRNPNSYSGIFWTLGRYDRPWGPKRPIFGSVRYMSSENTARKLDVAGYLRRYAPTSGIRQPSLL
jgi:deoxyribodipyrimidine photo-lyase